MPEESVGLNMESQDLGTRVKQSFREQLRKQVGAAAEARRAELAAEAERRRQEAEERARARREKWERFVGRVKNIGSFLRDAATVPGVTVGILAEEGGRRIEEAGSQVDAWGLEMRKKINTTLEEAKNQGRDVVHQVGESLDKFGRGVERTVNDMMEKASRARDRLSTRFNDLRDQANEKLDDMREAAILAGLRPFAWLGERVADIFKLPAAIQEWQSKRALERAERLREEAAAAERRAAELEQRRKEILAKGGSFRQVRQYVQTLETRREQKAA